MLKLIEELTLSTKLVMGFGLLLLIVFGLGVHSVRNQWLLSEETQVIYDKELLGVAHVKGKLPGGLEASTNRAVMPPSLFCWEPCCWAGSRGGSSVLRSRSEPRRWRASVG